MNFRKSLDKNSELKSSYNALSGQGLVHSPNDFSHDISTVQVFISFLEHKCLPSAHLNLKKELGFDVGLIFVSPYH